MAIENLPESTPMQMAFDVFEDLFSKDMSIVESTTDIGFQRNNAIFQVTNLGAACYKLLDTVVFVVIQEKDVQGRYDVDLDYFKWLMKYESNNYGHLRTIFRELQKAAIELVPLTPEEALAQGESPENGGAIPMIGAYRITKGRVFFEMSPPLQRHLKDPTYAHWQSLRVTAQLTLVYARVIYNHLLPYIDDGHTPWFTVEEVQGWPGAKASKAAYKYFKRDQLDPAIKQLNEVEHLDINVSYETKGGQGPIPVTHLRFRVTRKGGQHNNDFEQKPLALNEADELYHVLNEEFAIGPKNFGEIQANREKWTDQWIWQAVEFTRWNLEKGKITKSPSGFLMHALRNNLRVSSAEKIMEEQNRLLAESRAAKAGIAKAREDALSQSHDLSKQETQNEAESLALQGLSQFDALDLVGQEAYFKEFCNTFQAKLVAKREKVNLEAISIEELRNNKLLSHALGIFVQQAISKS
ncbi:cytochrome C oxidase Cbb3 [Novimethylophilus kurashikiensis]|uniref:Cytochrome C oxidase Cbb3 n=1 Tax=Novimethylophilus kurashikiensis TaxID=1825523 RepID=A0A2R5F8C6_9PROT|nr:replication initiation protein [Novimethylophilus kurashikiensis]GBG14500.1 cytochrome C oxidase Cbb3 [Novimethylophilus kurashikiensis]